MTQVTMVKGDATKFCDQDWQIEANKAAGWTIQGEKSEDLDLEALKAEADKLGVKYAANIGAKKLAERIEAKKAESE